MTPPPLAELPAALARVDCSGERHTIRWQAGDLQALDHDDPEGERALAALGGASCPCLDVLGAWSRQRTNAGLLTMLSRGTPDVLHPEGFGWPPFPAGLPATGTRRNMVIPASAANRTPGGWVAVTGAAIAMGGGPPGRGVAVPPGTAGPTLEGDVLLLAGLGQALTLRLVATVTAALLDSAGGTGGAPARPALEASLLGRVTCALRTWLAIPDLEVELRMTQRDAGTGVDWDGSGPVRVALPPEWVITVWGRDLTVTAGRFSLAVLESSATRTTLLTVGPDLGAPRPLAVELL